METIALTPELKVLLLTPLSKAVGSTAFLFLKTSDWPFNPHREVTEKICLDSPVYDLSEGSEVSSIFPCTAVSTDFAFPWEEYSSFSKIKRLNVRESFPAECKQLAAGKHKKTSRRLLLYSIFIGPNGLVRTTSPIQRLTATAFETRHPIILDSRIA